MPATSEKQRRAACAELSRRRRGIKGGPGRPFASASMEQLREFCRGVKRQSAHGKHKHA